MDDFLHNLRSGNLRKSNTGNRRQYSDQHSKHPNRRVADRRQKDGDQQLTAETLGTIKEVLQQFTATQQQLAAAQEQLAAVETRTAIALESIAASLEARTGDVASTPADDSVKTPAEISAEPSIKAAESTKAAPAAAPPSEPEPTLGDKISALREQKLSYARIADQLIQEGVPTPSGRGQWRGTTVQRILERHRKA